MGTSKIPSRDFASVTYDIPSDTSAHHYNYPDGYNKDNCTLISAKCITLNGTVVDSVYASSGINNAYFGNLIYQSNYFTYQPFMANTSKIIFTFAKIA